jgi:hypothetical protein
MVLGMISRPLLLVSAACLATACGSAPGNQTPDAGPGGHAPVVSSLTIQPNTVPVGQTTRATLTFGFTDVEGDVASAAIQIALPDGTLQPVQTIAAQGTAGQKNGTLGVLVDLTPPSAGQYTLSVWVTDVQENESNRLQGTVTAQ